MDAAHNLDGGFKPATKRFADLNGPWSMAGSGAWVAAVRQPRLFSPESPVRKELKRYTHHLLRAIGR